MVCWSQRKLNQARHTSKKIKRNCNIDALTSLLHKNISTIITQGEADTFHALVAEDFAVASIEKFGNRQDFIDMGE